MFFTFFLRRISLFIYSFNQKCDSVIKIVRKFIRVQCSARVKRVKVYIEIYQFLSVMESIGYNASINMQPCSETNIKSIKNQSIWLI